ncbi:MAG: hypothetical protein JWO56_3477, partial [Acidobacteria bacterium]|nr:hypothetical protein [Acidobacteriota bacterium]
MIRRLAILFLLLSAVSLTAQQESPYTPTRPLPLGDTLLSLPT